jgi:hypothetical protein
MIFRHTVFFINNVAEKHKYPDPTDSKSSGHNRIQIQSTEKCVDLLYFTLERYFTENWEKIFPRKETARGLSPNFYIHITVSDLCIPTNQSAYLAAAK